MMGTKETSEKLLASLYERAKRDAGCPNNFKTTLRCVELLRILQGLGVFCFIGDDGTTPAVSYRGRTYFFDMVDPYHLGFYMDIATFNDDDDDARWEMYTIFNEVNWTSYLMHAYEVSGQVVLSSSQYIGERKIFCDEVVHMMKAMDETAGEFHRMIKRNEYLNENATCI